MTGREIVHRTISFENPERMARCFPLTGQSDFAWCSMAPKLDGSFRSGVDAWGVDWNTLDPSRGGQVHQVYIHDWNDLSGFHFPTPDEADWAPVRQARAQNPDAFLIGGGSTLYSRLHYLRGQENTWADIYENPEQLTAFIDRLCDLSCQLAERYAACGVDGYMLWDDWGLQDRLMVSPATWRQIWKPRYARIFQTARKLGLRTLMHSCGYILDILPDLIECGLEVIQQDQQANMGLNNLGRYAGKITFFCPADIQQVLPGDDDAALVAYCRQMAATLGQWPAGGFLPMQYADIAGAGHAPARVKRMIDTFIQTSYQLLGK